MLHVLLHSPTAATTRRTLLLAALAMAAACDDPNTPATGNGPTLDSGLPGLDGTVPGQDGGQDGSPGEDAGPVEVTEDASVATGQQAMTGDPALDGARGDYLLRFHTITDADNALFGKITTESTSFGVMRVVAEGTSLVGYEYLCYDTTVQTASNGSVATTVDPSMWPNLSPVKRPLTLDTGAGTWSTQAASRRQGWRESAAAMPTDPVAQSADFLDPDTDGRPGVATRIAGEGIIFAPLKAQIDCQYDIVSTTTTRYSGTLSADGLPAAAQIVDAHSDVYALNAMKLGGAYECTQADINDGAPSTTQTDELSLSRVANTWLDTAGVCPSEADFQAAFP